MALYKINGHYLTYVEGYVEADTAGEARQKAKYGRQWKTTTKETPIYQLLVDYVKEVDEISPFHVLKTQIHPAFGKGSNGHT